ATRQIDLGSGGDRIELPASHDRLGVYDRTGRLVAGSGPPRADAVVAATLRTGRPSGQDVSGRLLSAAPLLVRERVAGAVRAQRTAAAAVARTHRAWLRLFALAIGVIAGAGLAALWLGRQLSAPLERLDEAAQRLGRGDFATRAPRFGVAEADRVAATLDATAE